MKKVYSVEEKQAWKEERLSEQKQLLENSVATLTASDAWADFVKFGRANLSRLTLNNSLMIWAQKRDARIVWGKKQWEKQGVSLNENAKALKYFAPAGFYILKDANGNEVLDKNGNPQKRMFFRVVSGYDITDTNAPEPEMKDMVDVEGDDMMSALPGLEQFARLLGWTISYEDVPEKPMLGISIDERAWQIRVDKNLSGNTLVYKLAYELARIYGNVNYTDYTKEEANVLTMSAATMALGLIGYDVSEITVPYIAAWSDGDLKALHKYVRLVDELAKELAHRMQGKDETDD